MAKENKKKYPMLGQKNWWALRNKFKERLPDEVTNTYLATVLDIVKVSAKSHVMPHLKIIGLIDDEGKTAELANKWRDDGQYAEVCKEIREKVYPKELLDAVADPITNQEAVKSWFMNTTKAGEKKARQMTVFYILVSQADLSVEKEVSISPTKRKRREPAKEKVEVKKAPMLSSLPSIHIDLQIHISPETKPEQIDKIFESIAKHFKEFYPLHKSK